MAFMTKKERLKRIEELKKEIEFHETKMVIENELCPIGVASVTNHCETKVTPIISEDEIVLGEGATKIDNFRIEYARKGAEIICKIYDLKIPNIVGVGKARCNTSCGDVFKYEFGLVLSELRARADLYEKMSNDFIDKVYDNNLMSVFNY